MLTKRPAEIRVTIEALDANGNTVASDTVLFEPEQDGAIGDIETALDALLESENDYSA